MTITATSRKRETEHSGRSKGTKDKNPRKMHPNSLNNLKPFENGHPPLANATPGNGYSLKSALKVSLGKPLKQPAEDAPARDHIVYATLKGAINCEPTFAHLKEVWDRVEGKVLDKTPPANQDNRVINFLFILPDGTKVSPKALIERE